MKRRFLVLAIIFVMIVAVCALASCEGVVTVPGVTGPNGNGTGNGTGANTVKTYTITYRFNNETILIQTVNSGSILSEEQIEERDALNHKGEVFTGFFSDPQKTEEYDFDKKIYENKIVYCQLLYTVTYHYEDAVILRQKVDALDGYLSSSQLNAAKGLEYNKASITGYFSNADKTDVYDFSSQITGNTDVYCQILCKVVYRTITGDYISEQYLDSSDGFTDVIIAKRDSMIYHGYNLDYFYTDKSKTDEFDFESTIYEDTTIYCDRDTNKAGPNVTWRYVPSTTGATLYFEGSGPMYEYVYYDIDVPWHYYYSMVTDIYVESGITSIADCAFYGFTAISSVSFPDTVEYIGENAFYKSSVTNVDFPTSLKRIGGSAFHECLNIIHLNFNPGLSEIGNGAFYGCKNVVSVILTDTLLEMEIAAFQECVNLSTVYYTGTKEQYDEIAQNISNDSIDKLAFKYYYSDTEPAAAGPYWKYTEEGDIYQWYYTIWYIESTDFVIPFDVDYIDADGGVTQDNIDYMNNMVYHGYRFYGWNLFRGFKVSVGDKYQLTLGQSFTEDLKIVGDRKDYCGDNVKWAYKNGTLTISKVDASNEDGAMWDFEYYYDAPWYAKLHNSISRIVISDGVTHIGKYAFNAIFSESNYYDNLAYIDIPTSVTSVDGLAFNGCRDLLYIYYAGTEDELANVTGLDNLGKVEGLEGINKNIKVYSQVTSDQFETLGEGAYWCYMTDSVYNNVRRVAWAYEDGSILVGGGNLYSGTSDLRGDIMINYASLETTPWYSLIDEVTSIIINSNIETIGENSFCGMTNVSEIIVSDFIIQIGANAFNNTKYYNEMYESTGVVYVYNNPENESLKNGHIIKVAPSVSGLFIMEEKTVSIAAEAFAGCSGITELVFTKNIGIQSVHETAMTGLTGLEKIYFYCTTASNEAYETWFNKYENTLIGEGELLENVPVYFHSPIEINNDDYSYWYWNSDKTVPIIYGTEAAEGSAD